MHSCMGIIKFQLVHQLPQSSLLLRSACVLGCFSVLGHTTNIADANAVGIMPQAMGTSYVLSTSLVDAAVTIDDIVITYVGKLASKMPTANVLHREVLAFGGGTAVYDDFGDFTHEI